MQLPQKSPGGVEKFASVPSGAAMAASQAKMREAQAIAGVVDAIGEGVQTQAELMLDREEKHEKLSIGMQRSAFNAQNAGIEYFTSDQVDDDIIVPGGRKKKVVDENGKEIEVNRKIPRAEVLPAMYQKHMQKAITAAASNISSRVRSDKFAAEQTEAAMEEHAELTVRAEAAMLKTYRDEQDAQIAMLAEAGQGAEALELARTFPGSEMEQAERVKGVKTQLEQNYINDLKSTEARDLLALGDIEYEIEQLRDLDNVSREMPDEDRLKAADELERVSYNNAQNLKASETRENERVISDLEVRVRTDPNSVTAGEIKATHALGIGMTQDKRTSLLLALETKQATQTKEANENLEAAWFMQNDTTVAPGMKGAQKGLDRYFTAEVKDGVDPLTATVNMASKTGYIPEYARNVITAANSAYSPQMKDGLMMYSAVARTNPNALQYIPDAQVNRIKTIRSIMKSGKQTFAQAIDIQRAWELKTPAEQQYIKEQFTGKDFAKASKTSLKNLIDDAPGMTPEGFTEFTPDIPEQMNLEYQIKTREYLPSVGYDLGAAEALAFEDIQVMWGLTNMTQRGVESGYTSDATYMKFAPYGDKEAIKFSLESQYGEGEFEIVSDAVSDRNHQDGDPISYEVYKVDPETGVPIRQAERWTQGQTAEAAEKLRTEVATDKARASAILGAEAAITRLEASRVRLRESHRRGLTSNEAASDKMDEYNAKIEAKKKELEELKRFREKSAAAFKPPAKEPVRLDTPPIPVEFPKATGGS